MTPSRPNPGASRLSNRLERYFPVLTWTRDYDRGVFASDMLAAVVVTIMLIPQSLAYALLAGFGDNVGSMEANNYISFRRAEAVADYLMSKFNLPRERLILSWYGYLNPIANNNLPEGRALNRRVEIAIGGI